MLEQIKKLVVIAMFSDNELEEVLVLKGGNALDLVLKLSARASVDVDFSMQDDLPEDLPTFRNRVEAALQATFRPEGLEVFDVQMAPAPETVSAELADFWGGYVIEFKIIRKELFDLHTPDLDSMRNHALQLGRGKKFLIDISRFEYTAPKEPQYLDGFRIFVYSPEMIVCEKLRAICQQMPEYGEMVKRNRPGGARARDFVDIFTLVQARGIKLSSVATQELLKRIFEAKKVPLPLLGRIKDHREFHRGNFPAVVATVKPGVELRDFDYYFDFVLRLVDELKPLWDV
jgi:hypothetical protein